MVVLLLVLALVLLNIFPCPLRIWRSEVLIDRVSGEQIEQSRFLHYQISCRQQSSPLAALLNDHGITYRKHWRTLHYTEGGLFWTTHACSAYATPLVLSQLLNDASIRSILTRQDLLDYVAVAESGDESRHHAKETELCHKITEAYPTASTTASTQPN